MAGRLVTSLDYINLPNPVEPLAAPPAHPFHGSSSLHTQDPGRVLVDSHVRDLTSGSSAKRRRIDGDTSQARDLPKLPTRPGESSKGRRTRLPPTLSGLHHPPPNAGLLPSIKVQQPPKQLVSAVLDAAIVVTPVRPPVPVEAVASSLPIKDGRSARNKWSEQETADLLHGVAKFGAGNWTKILKCAGFNFDRRTALDLKDRFRVCCPDRYGKASSVSRGQELDASTAAKASPPARTARSERKDPAELARFGIVGSPPESQRRSRRGYSAAEDEALLRGFAKHGKAWALILQDEKLELHHRKPTDLRDRFRQRYPEMYAKSGLAARPDIFPPPANRGKQPDRAAQSTPQEGRLVNQTAATSSEKAPSAGQQHSLSTSHPRRPGLPDSVDSFSSLLQHEYDFFDDDELDAQPIVLGRGILDWALEPTKLKPPVHHRARSEQWVHGGLQAHSSQQLTMPSDHNVSGTMLPSLATITASNDFDLQLELPSMNDYFNPLLSDGRMASAFNFPSLDELVGQNP